MRPEDDLCRRVDRGVLSPRDVTVAGWGIIVGRRLGGAVFDAAQRPINDKQAGSRVPQRGCKGTLGCHTAALQVLESYFQRHVGSVSRFLVPQFFFIGQHRTCPSRPGAGIQVSRVAGGVDRYLVCKSTSQDGRWEFPQTDLDPEHPALWAHWAATPVRDHFVWLAVHRITAGTGDFDDSTPK